MKHAAWSYDAVIYEMNIRQTTPEGTFRSAAERLPLLRNIGVDALWLMPVFPIGRINRKGYLGSYYSISDYYAVNPEFGTMSDFDDFVAEAHRLGMRVLLDWVANHTSRDAAWLSDRPTDWYERNADGSAKVPCDWDDTAKLNYANREVWRGEIDAMSFWLREHDIDGFRCDMAMLVPIEFWQQARRELQHIKPDVFLLAEAEEQNLFDNAFDASYTWQLHHILCDVAQGRRRVWDLRNYVCADRERYPQWAMRLMFTSNHDENSWNGSEFVRFGAAAEIMAALTFVLPQSLPLIYTGQEYGYDHSFAFFDKDPMPLQQENRFTSFYRRLCALKHSNPALRSADAGGSFVEINNNAPDCMMTFVRETADNRVVVLMNLSPYNVLSDYRTGIYAGEYRDAMTGERYVLNEHVWGETPAWSYRILVSNK
ncbi:MAG: alpha-amylase family glycosyl hydrolase [Alistipes sp.]